MENMIEWIEYDERVYPSDWVIRIFYFFLFPSALGVGSMKMELEHIFCFDGTS